MAHIAVRAGGDELSRLGHDAERAAKSHENENCECVAGEDEKRRDTARGERELAAGKKDDDSRKVPISAEIRGSAPRAFAIGWIRTTTVAARMAR